VRRRAGRLISAAVLRQKNRERLIDRINGIDYKPIKKRKKTRVSRSKQAYESRRQGTGTGGAQNSGNTQPETEHSG
jgi:hypothetical protein